MFTGDYLHVYVDANRFGNDVDTNVAGSMTGSFYIALRDATYGHANTEIDELAVYDAVLPESRVQAHYDIGVGK